MSFVGSTWGLCPIPLASADILTILAFRVLVADCRASPRTYSRIVPWNSGRFDPVEVSGGSVRGTATALVWRVVRSMHHNRLVVYVLNVLAYVSHVLSLTGCEGISSDLLHLPLTLDSTPCGEQGYPCFSIPR